LKETLFSRTQILVCRHPTRYLTLFIQLCRFSLVFHQAEGYLAIIKDFYEAYVIYQFLGFCIAVLGKGDRERVVDLLARRADHLTPPFRLFGVFQICGCCKTDPYESNRHLADAILLQCQFFAMQFVLFRPLTTTAMVVLEKLHYYGGGTSPTDYRSPQFYLVLIQNLSIFVAFTGLLKFYHAVDKDLAWCRPFAKFLCIKGVVFMTFWQGLAISLLAQTTDVGPDNPDDATEWAQSAQNFLICTFTLYSKSYSGLPSGPILFSP
jgi:Organic solute transporter Ostalpha